MVERPANFATQLELLSEALRKTQEEAIAGQLALEVMHEVRSPLEALANIIYLISLAANDPHQVREYVRLAEEQITSLSQVANHTLGFGRSSQGAESVDLTTLAEASLRVFRGPIHAKKIRVMKDLPEPVHAPIHRGQILQVLSNLIENALDAMPAGGTLALRLRKRQDGVHFIIADNGPGIPPPVVERVFEPFFTTKKHRGTGLGLSLSKKIIEKHGGKIRLRSCIRPGRNGTMFKVSLPA